MRVEKRGNVYRKVGWLKEHEEEIWTALCVVVGFAAFVVAMLIRG